MGSEHSTLAARETTREDLSPLVLQSPTTAALREGAVSPRQGSICSDSDVPYVSYTVNKPIGDSPKKTAEKTSSKQGRFTSPRLAGRFNRDSRLAASKHNTLVTVNRELKLSADIRYDPDIVRLQDIPAFLPIMRSSTSASSKEEEADLLGRLNPAPLNGLMQRYEEHLRSCAAVVAAEQGALNKRVKEVDGELAAVTAVLTERQKKYEKHCGKLATVRDISRSLARCHMLLNENIDMLDALNNVLPVEHRLEPFVWTTG